MIGHEQDGAGPAAGQAVPVAEAAAYLGLTPETLRKRLWRGQLAGEKRDGQWYVVLPCLPNEQDQAGPGQDRAGPPPDGEQDNGQDEAGHEQDYGPAVLITELRDRVAFLEAAIERRDRDLAAALERLREAHVLAAQQAALPAPSQTSDAASAEQGAISTLTPRPWWWRWWPIRAS
jgi:hypothetical protein